MKARLVILLLLVGSAFSLWGQGGVSPNDAAVKVAGGGAITLQWTSTVEPDTFYIYRWRLTDWQEIGKIYAPYLKVYGKYTYPLTNEDDIALMTEGKDTVYYAVEAYNASSPGGRTSVNINSKPPLATSNIMLTGFVEDCSETVQLNWNNQFNKNAKVMKKNSDGSYSQYTDVSFLGTTSCLVRGLTNLTSYIFYVELLDASYNSTSNEFPILFSLPREPEVITCDNINTLSDDEIQFTFYVDTIRDLDYFTLYRYNNISKGYDSLITVNTSSSRVIISDKESGLGLKNQRYKFAVLNNCGMPKKYSKEYENILLVSDDIGNGQWDITWTDISRIHSPNPLSYRLHRVRNGVDEVVYDGPNEFYRFQSSTIVLESVLEEITFYVEAYEESNEFDVPCHVFSNKVIITIEGKIGLPDFITPNNDTKNDRFSINPCFPDGKLIIYDRWGVKVFEAEGSKICEGWDGKYKGGKKAPMGAYIYYLKVVGADGKSKEQSGSFTVFYP